MVTLVDVCPRTPVRISGQPQTYESEHPVLTSGRREDAGATICTLGGAIGNPDCSALQDEFGSRRQRRRLTAWLLSDDVDPPS
jgi:hypothetical protein